MKTDLRAVGLALAVALASATHDAAANDERPGSFGLSISVDGEGFFVEATLKSVTVSDMAASSPAARAGIAPNDRIRAVEGTAMRARLDLARGFLDAHLAESPWLAGANFTTADVMTVFSVTTMRIFHPLDLAPFPGILGSLQRVGARPAYRRAMERGDPGFTPMLT